MGYIRTSSDMNNNSNWLIFQGVGNCIAPCRFWTSRSWLRGEVHGGWEGVVVFEGWFATLRVASEDSVGRALQARLLEGERQ